MFELLKINLQGQVSATEWQSRIDSAACYRLMVMHGWDDIIHTHVSARILATVHLLNNTFGLAFEEVTASNIVKIDIVGIIIDKNCPFEINPAGFTIHSAIHEARHDELCVFHVHTNDVISMASLEDGLLPLSQYSMFAMASMSYHD